jgi:hypothetical protein
VAKEKNSKFTETIELQIFLNIYDPQKDKRFTTSVINCLTSLTFKMEVFEIFLFLFYFNQEITHKHD